MINDLKLCTIVTNKEGRVSFDEDHMRLDARNLSSGFALR